jgi:hypothetical protein
MHYCGLDVVLKAAASSMPAAVIRYSSTAVVGKSRSSTTGWVSAWPGARLPDILGELGMVAEGVRTTRIVHAIAEREGLHRPITMALYRVLDDDLDLHRALDGLMAQPTRAEVDADSVGLLVYSAGFRRELQTLDGRDRELRC